VRWGKACKRFVGDSLKNYAVYGRITIKLTFNKYLNVSLKTGFNWINTR
jgi:hypothetical protein